MTRYILALPILLLTASLFLWFASDSAAAGNIYYVDSSITDTNPASGTPDCTNYNPATFSCSGGSASAYKTIADVNAGSFSPDDQILFRKGQVWRETLVVPSSGSPGQPITFGSFGSGAQPKISGGDAIPAVSWSAATDVPIWQAAVQTADTSWQDTGSNNLNFRIYVKGAQVASSSNSVKIKFKHPFTSSSTFISSAYIGVKKEDTDAFDFGATPTQVTFGGNGAVTLLADDGYTTSDTIAFPIAVGTDYLIAFHTNTGSWAPRLSGGVAPNQYYRTAADESAVVDVTGYGSLADIRSVASIEAPATAVWQATVATQPKTVVFNGIVGIKESSPSSLDAAHEWAWSNGILYVYATSAPGSTIEVGARNYCATANAKSYLTFTGLHFDISNLHDIYIDGNSTDIVISNSTLSRAYNHGFSRNAMNTLDNLTIEDSVSEFNGSLGILLAGGPTGGISNAMIQRNILRYNGQIYEAGGVENTWGGGMKLVGGTSQGHIIQNNTAYRNGYRSDNSPVTEAQVKGTGIWADLITTAGSGSDIRYNLTYQNANDGIYIEKSKNQRVYYNVSHSNGDNGINVSDSDGLDSSNTVGNTVYNNTMYNNVNAGLAVIGDWNQADVNITDNIFKNNISVGNIGSELLVRWGGENDGWRGTGNVYQANSFGAAHSNFIQWAPDDAGVGGYYATYSGWEANYCGPAGCSSSVGDDPLFTNAAGGDFTLQATSPAIDAGADVGLTSDYQGTAVPQGAGPDIGAYEYTVTIGDSQFQIGQTISEEIAFVIPPADVTLSPALGGVTGGTANGSTQFVVVTNNSAGFDMTLKTAANEGMLGTALGGAIPALVPVGEVPKFDFDDSTVAANTAAFAYTIEASTTDDLDQKFRDDGNSCGSGSSDTLDSCWLNGSTTDVRVIHRTTPTPSTGAVATLKFRAVLRQNATPAITEDTYTATTTITVTMN
jgi:hypothetical protein